MSAELYNLKNIKRVFGSREVLSIDSLALTSGLIYGLLGPNGSGKTTLMKILAFLDEPNSGSISFKGREADRRNMSALRSEVVWSPQFPVMFTGSLRYNVEYPMKLKGLDSAARRRRAGDLLAMVGLTDLAEAPAYRLSGGEAQRASLARALAADAKVLLLDEPTANVDASSRRGLVRLIEDLWNEQHLSIIVTTHDNSLEAELCQRRIHLLDGQIASVDEAVVHPASLRRDGEQIVLMLFEEAAQIEGPLMIREIGVWGSEIMIKLAGPDRRLLNVKIKGQSLELARRLSLSDSLMVQTFSDHQFQG